MKLVPTDLEGVQIVEPDVHHDPRGFFLESYRADRYAALSDRELVFVQDNHSRSSRGTLRGLHAQLTRPQAKLVRVIAGEIFDVVVDIRRGSPTFKRWVSVILSSENFRQLFVPAGFAHGLCVISEFAEVEYKCTDFYDPSDELRLLWNDPELAVDWPIVDPILSDKDRAGRPLADWWDRLPVYAAAP